MKLIIDIPEDVVTAIQNGQDYRYDIHTAIAQGKPCDASGDLISRNALIQHTYSAVVDGVETDIIDASDVDNAPTVDITETISKFRNTAYQNGFTTGLNKRPQGDLISREALKKALNEATYNFEQIPIRVDKVQEIIDNAPTVEPKLKDNIIEAFNQITDQEFEHSDSFWIVTPKGKKIEFEKKRPQGEWIKKVDDVGFVSHICSKCGFELELEDCSDSYYCTNCGAKMG